VSRALFSLPVEAKSYSVVVELRKLFEKLFSSELASVRPAEALAYFAITRPEVDRHANINPLAAASANDTRVNTPAVSPIVTPINSPEAGRPLQVSPEPEDDLLIDLDSPTREQGSDSILGKRLSEDRDFGGPNTPFDRRRHRSDDFVHVESVGSHSPNVSYDGSNNGLVDLTHVAGFAQEVPKMEDESYEKPLLSATSLRFTDLDIQSPAAEQDGTHTNIWDHSATVEIPEADSEIEQKESVRESAPSPPSSQLYLLPFGSPPRLPPRPTFRDRKPSLAAGLQFGLQQDSAEVLLNVISQLEMALDRPSVEGQSVGANLINKLFSCKFSQQTFLESAGSTVENPKYDAQPAVEGIFTQPIIGVEQDGRDIYDCLAELYLHGDEIELNGKKGYKMDLMSEFPPLLYIQMRRSYYDRATQRERKLNTHIPFFPTLSMDRFLRSADAQKREESIDLARQMVRARDRLKSYKTQAAQLTNDLNDLVPSPAPFDVARDPDTMDVDQDPSTPVEETVMAAVSAADALRQERTTVEREASELQQLLDLLKAKMEDLWARDHAVEYELVSVYMHRGASSSGGHYWTYQCSLPTNPRKFFAYNDETVTEVEDTEVFKDRTGDEANPALLCYVRRGQDLVDVLYRAPVPEQSSSLELELESASSQPPPRRRSPSPQWEEIPAHLLRPPSPPPRPRPRAASPTGSVVVREVDDESIEEDNDNLPDLISL
jgi:ubiquitin carboxyl-terminal hydrolase 25/28